MIRLGSKDTGSIGREAAAGDAELAKWGITSLRTKFGLRINIPPLRSWRNISRGYAIWVVVLMAMGILPAFATAFQRPIDPVGFLASGEYCVIALIVALFALNLTQRRIFIDVTYDQLAITFIRRSGHFRQLIFPRAELLEVKASTINRKLIIHAQEREMTSIYLNPDIKVTQWIASAINSALAEPLSVPALVDQFPLPAPGRFHASLGRVLVWVAVALTFAGAAVMVAGIFQGIALIVFAVVCLIAAAGITYGTQEKDFY